MESLATKWRPQEFSDVSSQKSLIQILSRQIETKLFKNVYMFCGPSGCGKTTIARIFARKLNNSQGLPIEIDGASNNGVDNVRDIIDNANQRALDAEYKVFIIDEAHQITTAGWNAFLKCIEEPPKYTIFIFCTTDPQKVPQTIINRCQVFNLSRVDDLSIKNRLAYISNQEGFNLYEDAADQIVSMSQGSMRQAISYLDKCKDFSTDITLNNVIECLGEFSYDVFFSLTNCVIDNNKQGIIDIIDRIYDSGTDLKLFITNYFSFVLQLTKFCLFNSMTGVKIPQSYEEKIKYTVGIENGTQWFSNFLDKLLEIKREIKGDSDMKTTIEVMLMSAC